MAGTARQKNHDHRLVRLADAGRGLRREQLWQGQPAQAERANLEEISA
jgi:hypothetical protein